MQPSGVKALDTKRHPSSQAPTFYHASSQHASFHLTSQLGLHLEARAPPETHT